MIVGALNRLAKGSFSGWQGGGKVEGGRDIPLEGGFIMTPSLSVDYSHLSLDGYTETGADAANLMVASQSYDLFTLGLRAGVKKDFKLSNGTLTPEGHLGILYEILDQAVESTATFTGGGAAFTTQGADTANAQFNLGFGATFVTLENLTLAATYDLGVKSDYTSHSGTLRARIEF